MTGFEPVQTPASQTSVCVQALPSLQAVPLALLGFEQVPLAGSQTPASWHWSEAVQVTGFVPMQDPFWQVSVWVQALPSLHRVPLALRGWLHTPVLGSQVPAKWQSSGALQTTGSAPTQTPLWQLSACVHALPSLQAVPSVLGSGSQRLVLSLHTPRLH